MADYGSVGGGRSLRDALNEIMPMLGMGEYGAMFPPQAGAPEPTAPVPLPQQRPPLPGGPVPQQGLSRPPVPGYPPPDEGLLTRPPLPGGPPTGPLPPRPTLPPQMPQQSYTQRLGLGS